MFAVSPSKHIFPWKLKQVPVFILFPLPVCAPRHGCTSQTRFYEHFIFSNLIFRATRWSYFSQISNWNTCSDKYRYTHGANQEGYANSALPWKIRNACSAIALHVLMKVEFPKSIYVWETSSVKWGEEVWIRSISKASPSHKIEWCTFYGKGQSWQRQMTGHQTRDYQHKQCTNRLIALWLQTEFCSPLSAEYPVGPRGQASGSIFSLPHGMHYPRLTLGAT